ncbi:MAG: FdhF/YdeP family oxidoreductase [Poseidonibacter sp.]
MSKTHSNVKVAGGWGALKSSAKFIFQADFFKTSKTLLSLNQVNGVDCPGCAWPDPDSNERSMNEYCENGVKAIAFETTKKRASRELFNEMTVSQLNELDVFDITNKGRLTEPFYYNKLLDKYEAISWQKAFYIVSKHLKNINDPDDAIFYTSGRTSNEAAFLYQLMGRMIGTNNFPDCSNMCHESSGVGMGESIGIGKGTVSLEDFDKAELIMVFGQNPGTNHPRMLSELQKANKRGAKIVSINPLKEAGLVSFIHPQDIKQMLTNKEEAISTHYYQVKMGSDMALIQAIVKYILENHNDALDYDFINDHTAGFEDYKNEILNKDWDILLEQTSLSKKEIIEIATLYIKSNKTICCWAMGLTQHQHGVATIQELMNLLLIKGNIGKEGAGACPVRGHSNVQGDRTVGISEAPKEDFLAKIDSVFNFTSPRSHGVDVVHAIKAMHKDKNKVFIGLGGNFADAAPDTKLTYEALRACKLTVHISTHLNKSHLICGEEALILPCLGRTELDIQQHGVQSITVEDSMSMVHSSKGKNIPITRDIKSEPAIIAGIANATLGNEKVDFLDLISDYSKIREKIEEVLPSFNSYNKAIKKPGGFELYNSAKNRVWETATKKANFIINQAPNLKLEDKHLSLMTMRSHDQFNTTVYGTNDRYRGIENKRKIIFLNEKDIKSLGLKNKDIVNIQSHSKDNIKREVFNFEIIAYDIKQGCAAAYFPEATPLVSIEHFDNKSFTPSYKFIDITLTKAS